MFDAWQLLPSTGNDVFFINCLGSCAKEPYKRALQKSPTKEPTHSFSCQKTTWQALESDHLWYPVVTNLIVCSANSKCIGSHFFVWHDSFMWTTWLISMRDMFVVWHDSFICMNDSFICVTWLIQKCDITPQYARHVCRHDPFMRVTWLVYMWDMTHSHVWHGTFLSHLI